MNWFWDNIHLKKEERTGMLVFLFILFGLILVKWYLVVLYSPEVESYNTAFLSNAEYTVIEPDIQEYKTETNASILPHKRREKRKREKKKSAFITKKNKVEGRKKKILQFDFDPNNTSLDSLLLLGIGKYAANNIAKYRTKGGKFFNADDLQKIYGIDSSMFNKLYPFIKIKEPKQYVRSKDLGKRSIVYSKPKLEFNSIDINLADTIEFKKLKGIGTVYANRIVKFRNSLGGYFSINQIKDVWGISDSLFTSIKPYLTINASLVEKRNINLLDKNTLVKHPYIDWKKAKVILSYKKMHGDYQSMDDFDNMHGIGDDFVDTLRHYFVVR